jgi:hypothetical protein
MNTACIPSLQRCWEDWLAAWRIGCLISVLPWDAALRAFAERAELLPRRMAALNLEPNTFARAEPAAFRELVRFCAACESDELCEWDLRQNPDDPAWQDYCPNAERLRALAASEQRDATCVRHDGQSRECHPLRYGVLPQTPIEVET